MSSNIEQIFVANPASSMMGTDLLYLGRSPYSATNDMAITWTNMLGSITTANGNVAAGTLNQIAYYAAGGTTVSGLATSDSGVLVTSSTGVPSILAAGTTGQFLSASSAGTPAWSTATYPQTTLINNLLFSSAANTVSQIAAVNNGVLISSASGVPSWLANGTTGQVLTATTGSPPSWGPASGSGTVNTGTINDLAYYAANGTAVSSLATADSGVLVTSSTGVPSILAAGTTGQLLQASTSGTPSWSTSTYPATNAINTLLYASAANVMSALATATTAVLTTAAGVPTWAAELSLALGGTNAGLTASNGGIVWSNATQLQILAGTATAHQLLLSGASATPVWSSTTYPTTNAINTLLYASSANVMSALAAGNSGVLVTSSTGVPSILAAGTTGQLLQASSAGTPAWSTTTYPATNAINTLLYASAANVMSALATTNSAILATTSAGVPTWIGSLTNGQLLIGSTTATPVAATLTAGTGIAITNAAGSITIASTGGGVTWTDVTGTSQALAVNNGYIADNAALVTLTLPTTAAQGTLISICGNGAGGWKVAQNASQNIKIGNQTTTTGTGGSLASTNQYDQVDILCTVANTTWVVRNAMGNITVV